MRNKNVVSDADTGSSEWFYIRPHQSGNLDAIQYMALVQNTNSWQLYHDEGYSASICFAYVQWIHFKLIINDNQTEVFINDMNKPALFVPELKQPVQGKDVDFIS